MTRSNFAEAFYEIGLDLGTAGLATFEPSRGLDTLYEFTAHPFEQVVFGENRRGRVDTVLRRIVGEDGTELQEDGSMSLKDALNLSLKVTQIMVRDLPKIYSLDRVQRQEEALRRVMETHLTREQQEALLEELEKIENPDAVQSVS